MLDEHPTGSEPTQCIACGGITQTSLALNVLGHHPEPADFALRHELPDATQVEGRIQHNQLVCRELA